jgi:uncharacterized membrane protein
MKLQHHHYTTTAYALSISAGLLYCLWFLGYYLNPKAMSNLDVSALQSVGQPHYGFFVIGDIATGVLMILLVACLIKIFHRTPLHRKISFWLCVIGLLAFGIMTATASIFPSCDSDSSYCVLNLSQVFNVHNITGTIASLGQFVSVIAALKLVHKKITSSVFWTSSGLLILWAISGITFITLSTNSFHSSLLMQHLFLVLSSVLLVIVPWVLIRSRPTEKVYS